jgi:carboxypeptidase Taq
MTPHPKYLEYITKMQKIADVKYASAVLQWDQEIYLPTKGANFRGQQLATLDEIAHELFTTEQTGNLLNQLNNLPQLTIVEKSNVALSLEAFKRQTKVSGSFVRQMSEAINNSYHAWAAAYKANDFNLFEPALNKVVDFKKQEADLIGYELHPYNALMNDYDKGLTTTSVDLLFETLMPALKIILHKINAANKNSNAILKGHFDKDQQWKFGLDLLKQIGFDFEAGRQDISMHPFTTSFNSMDVRVTTRIDEQDFGNMTWSCLHEGGHALYEQGLPNDQYGLPLGEYCSLSIHESQSRLWENNVGRGLSYWKYNMHLLQNYFPEAFGSVSVEGFYKAINVVQPSLIRTEADELTYHFHVMIRYEIEKALIEGSLKTKDIPEQWNALYKEYLGVDVPDDKRGCLQDIHWSHGSFGYFATYSLGSLYAAQLFHAVEQAHPTLNIEIENGNFLTINNWLSFVIRSSFFILSFKAKPTNSPPLFLILVRIFIKTPKPLLFK